MLWSSLRLLRQDSPTNKSMSWVESRMKICLIMSENPLEALPRKNADEQWRFTHVLTPNREVH